MGFVTDTAMARVIPPNHMVFTVGTWADAVSSHIWTKDKTAAANTSLVKIPVTLPQNSVLLKGAYLKSIDVWWTNATADLVALSAEVYRVTLPANGAAIGSATSLAFTYDANHDTAAKRVTQDEHRMTLALSTPFWVNSDDEVYVEVSINAAAGSVVKMFPARASYTLRL